MIRVHYRRICSPRRLAVLAAMRAAKARKRLAAAPEREPPMGRWFPLQLGLLDKATGETAWVDFRGLRDALRRLSVVRKFYLRADRIMAGQNHNAKGSGRMILSGHDSVFPAAKNG